MARQGEVVVKIVGDNSSLNRVVNQTHGLLGKLGSKFGSVGSIAAGVFGGQLLMKGFQFVKNNLGDVIAEARENVRIGKMSEAVLKSTGGAAHVTADHLGKLATKLSNVAGVDDEVIQGGENVLLTFTKVRNEVGKGNDVFDQATKAAVDVSAALGQDLQTSVIQIGKALNDPIKGMSALQRVGVSFTKQQKDQVKTLVEHGKTLEAQKIILKELQTEFGGAAAASADPMQKLGVVIQNVKERIGMVLLPYLDLAAMWLGKVLPGAIDKAASFFEKTLIPAIQKIVGWLVERVPGAFKKFKGFFDEAFKGGKKLVADLAKQFGTSQGTILKVIGAIAAGLVGLAIAWNLGPGIIVTGVVALVAGLLYAYNHFQGFRDGVNAALKSTRDFITNFIAGVKAAWKLFGDDILDFARRAWSAIRVYIEGVINVIRGIILVVTGLIHGDWGKVWEGIKKIFQGAWQMILGMAKLVGAQLLAILGIVWQVIHTQVARAWNNIVAAVKSGVNSVWTFVHTLPGRIFNALVNLPGQMFQLGITILQKLISGAGTYLPQLASWFKGIPGKIWNAVTSLQHVLFDLGKKLIELIIKGIKAAPGAITDAIKGLIPSPGSIISGIGKAGKFFGFAGGGIVPGRTGQPVPAIVHGGEAVFNPDQLKALGKVMSQQPTSGGSGGGLHIEHFHAGTSTPQDIARSLQWQHLTGLRTAR